MKHLRVIGLIPAILVGAAVLAVVLESTIRSDGPTSYQGPLAQSFGILRSTPDSPTPIEEGWINSAVRPFGQEGHLLAAHRMRTERGDLWVLPTRRLLCIAQVPHGSASCVPIRPALTEGVVVGTFDPPNSRIPHPHNFIVHGVVPDDVNQALVVMNHRQHRRVDVKGNSFSVSADKPIHVKELLP
jgi:hypothetical protein